MENMFYYAGYVATYSMNLSTWKVPLVTKYTNFNAGNTTKITAPTWVS